MAVTRNNFNARTKQVVYKDSNIYPYVGFEHLKESPYGWEYNIKRWSSLFDLRLPHLPRLADASTQGIPESEYFKSGVGSVLSGDLYIDRIDELFRDNERYWVPIIRHGLYYRFKTPFYLYSDNSRIQYIDPSENKNGRNYLELDVEPDMLSPITAATYARNPNTRTPYYYRNIKQVAEFTGRYVSGTEQETVTAVGSVLWNNVDTNKREFIIDNTREGVTALRFNNNYVETHGVVPTVFQDLAASEVLGMSNGSNYQVYYLKYFPVLADSSFHLYIAETSTWTEWERVDSWFELINLDAVYPGGTKYFLDKDLGIIYFGSSVNGGAPPLGSYIVVTYRSTLRIEYEEADLDHHVTALEANLNPVSQYINQGFVVITHDQLEAATITLGINKSKISFTNDPVEYGPIYIGSDYAVLQATVNSIADTAVSGVEVGFEMTPVDLGYLNGSSVSTSITNGRGEAFTSFQPPTSADTLGFYSTIVRACGLGAYPAHKEVILNTTQSGLDGKEDELYLFQILKDDILLGYDNVDDFIYQNIDYPSWVVDSATYARWKEELILDYEIKDWQTLNSGLAFDRPLSGRKVVVYRINPTTNNFDTSAINPVTGELGAIMPVRPSFIGQINDTTDTYNNLCRLVYPQAALPDCDPEDSNNNVGGYWAVSSRLVKFKAHCWSPYYNRIIYSNEVVARISLPNYLLGVYVNNLAQEIPFGWKFPTDTDSVAAGLDGATFITINPHDGPYNVLDLVSATTTDEWADAPFRSIGFHVGIAQDWAASTSYIIGDVIRSTDEDLYRCTTAGTSGTSEPSWDDKVGMYTTDNTTTWIRI